MSLNQNKLAIALTGGRAYAGDALSTFGKNLRRLRDDAKLTQQELATAIKRPITSISAWENDRYGLPDTRTLLLCAKALGVSIDDLVAGIDDDYDRLRKTSPVTPASTDRSTNKKAGADEATASVQRIRNDYREHLEGLEDILSGTLEDVRSRLARLDAPEGQSRRKRG